MTRQTNARIAGATFLLYIAVGIAGLILVGGATGSGETAARLATIAGHETGLRIVVLIHLLTSFAALVLGVTLHAITRDEDADLAMLGLICRVIEGIANPMPIMGLLWLVTPAARTMDSSAVEAFAAFFLRMGAWNPGAIFFAVGSTLFAWLLLRGRMVPAWLAGLGVVASLLLAIALPLQLTGFLGGPANWFGLATWLVWLPMLVFEVALALWLLVRGAAAPRPREQA